MTRPRKMTTAESGPAPRQMGSFQKKVETFAATPWESFPKVRAGAISLVKTSRFISPRQRIAPKTGIFMPTSMLKVGAGCRLMERTPSLTVIFLRMRIFARVCPRSRRPVLASNSAIGAALPSSIGISLPLTSMIALSRPVA